MPEHLHPYGCELAFDADGTPPFTSLTDMSNIKLPDMEVGSSNDTHLKSPDFTKEESGSWLDPGQLECKAYFTQAQFAQLYTMLKDRKKYFWEYTYPLLSTQTVGAVFEFRGRVNKIGFDDMVESDDGKIMCPFSIKVSGLPTFTPGA